MALTSEIVDAEGLVRLADAPSEFVRVFPPAADRPARLTLAPSHQRIVFVNRFFYPDVSATSQVLFDLARRLVEQGLEVHVVCSRQLYDDPDAVLLEHETIFGVEVHRVWTSRFGRNRLIGRAFDYTSFYLTGAAKLLNLLRTNDVVVAKTDPPLISIVAAAIARVRGARLINWLQDVFPEVASHLGANPLPRWLDGCLKRLRDRSLACAQTNVVLGERMREHLERRDIPGRRIQVIENWADDEAVFPMPASASLLRRSLGLQDKFVVGYSGNLGRAHEFETLLAAADALRDHRGIAFLMIGGGLKMNQLRREVLERRLTSFHFLPYQPREKLSDSLAAADVHLASLLPELEGLIVPSKFYGILAAARPTIFVGDPEGEIARITRDAQCGVSIERGDWKGLAQCFVTLMRDRDATHAMGQRARALFLRKYTLGRAASQWISLMQRVGFSVRERKVVVRKAA